MSMSWIFEAWRDFRERQSGNVPLMAGAILVPIMLVTGTAVDVGMAIQARQKLDAAAQSAAAAAVAQSRALRAIHPDVQPDEMMERGRGRADMVFNAQKPNVRNVRTHFSLERTPEPNTYLANFDYDAALPTIFLRVLGVRELSLRGLASATWVARDALIDDDFNEYEAEVRAAGSKTFAPVNGWISNARMRQGGSPVMQLAAAERYGTAPPPGVSVAVELDVGVGNSFIAKKFSADPGLHQIRYWYRDQARSEMVAPAWLCTTRDDDLGWMHARDRTLSGDTNRLSVHLMPDVSGKVPTSDVAFTAANRVDVCYSAGGRWIERVVKIDVAARGDYWVAFRAEGKPDGIGAAIANIVVCREPCARDDGEPRANADNFPWRRDEVLFEDRFAASGPNPISNSPARGARSGWDFTPPGWTVWPQNNVTYRPGANGASGHVELDVTTRSGSFENRAMGRPFLLVPGFYALRYAFSTGASQVSAPACNYFSLDAALQRVPRVRGADTRRISVHIDADFASLHPEVAGKGEEERAEWFTPARQTEREGKTERLPRLPNLANAVDFCIDAPTGIAVQREILFRIDRPGFYWVTFVGSGPADGEGGRISNVELLAKGSSPSGAGLPRLIRSFDRNDPLFPPVGAWLPMPHGSGSRAAYKVQLQ